MSLADQVALLTRGVIDLHVKAELEERLASAAEVFAPARSGTTDDGQGYER